MSLSVNSLMNLAAAPAVTPNLTFPGSEYLRLALGVVIGIVIFGLIALFFIGLVMLVSGFTKDKEKGIGGAVALMIASALALAVTIPGTVFLNRLIDFFGTAK